MVCVFSDGCLSHKIAVAAGALSQYLRFMVDPGSPTYQTKVSLKGTNFLYSGPIVGLRGRGQVGTQSESMGQQLGQLHQQNQENIKDELRPQGQGQQIQGHGEQAEIGLMLDKRNVGQEDYDDGDVKKDEEGDEGEEDEDEDEEEQQEDYNANNANEDNRAQDYYNGEQQSRRIVVPKPNEKDNLAPHKFQRERLGNAGQRDEEYEQYIDDNEEEQQKAKMDAPLGPLNNIHRGRKNDLFGKGDAAHGGEDDGYNYYDNEHDEDNPMQVELPQRQAKVGDKPLEEHKPLIGDVPGHIPSVASTSKNVVHGHLPETFDLTSTIGKMYLVIFGVTLILLYCMFRFVKQRRVVIKYYHR